MFICYRPQPNRIQLWILEKRQNLNMGLDPKSKPVNMLGLGPRVWSKVEPDPDPFIFFWIYPLGFIEFVNRSLWFQYPLPFHFNAFHVPKINSHNQNRRPPKDLFWIFIKMTTLLLISLNKDKYVIIYKNIIMWSLVPIVSLKLSHAHEP